MTAGSLPHRQDPPVLDSILPYPLHRHSKGSGPIERPLVIPRPSSVFEGQLAPREATAMAPMFVFNRVMATALDTAIPKQRTVTVPPDARASSTCFHQQPFLFHTACNHMHQNGLYEIPIFEDSSKTAFLSHAWLQDSQQAWQPKTVFAFLFLLGFMHREQVQSTLVGPPHTAFPIPLTLKAFNTLQGYSECLRRAWSQLMRALHGNTHAIGYSKHLRYKHKYSTRSQKKRHFKSSFKNTQHTGSAPVRLKLMELIPDHTASLPRAPRVLGFPYSLIQFFFPP